MSASVTVSMKVLGMTCGHCKMTVEGALAALRGVAGAMVDLGANTVTVTYDPGTVDTAALKKAIRDVGYTPLG